MLTRRAVVAGLGATVLSTRLADASSASRIVSLDYGIATTLLALGVTPAGVADAADWDVWVVEPRLPDSVVDLGDDLAVNLELLAALKPDLILSTPYLEASRAALERIAPVMPVTIFAEDGRPLERAREATLLIGERLGLRRQAELYLERSEAALEDFRTRVAALDVGELALVNFTDARHARIYGRHSLYQDVFDRIGIVSAWKGETNYWGFQTIAVEQLGRLDSRRTRLIAFEPVPQDVLPTLAGSPLWTALPFVRAGRVSTLPGVLMFGMMPSALRFAELVVRHLEELEP